MALGIGAILGIVNKALGIVRKIWDRLELAGAYVAGYLKHQKQTQEKEREERDDARDSRDKAEDMTDEEQRDILTGDDPDGLRDTEKVSGDTKSGDHN